uniref:Uncharacterized protein n=1 Tax=Rhizophora mucronata TaxID=61149 RepID=A0A2P2J550_RHIMU
MHNIGCASHMPDCCETGTLLYSVNPNIHHGWSSLCLQKFTW